MKKRVIILIIILIFFAGCSKGVNNLHLEENLEKNSIEENSLHVNATQELIERASELIEQRDYPQALGLLMDIREDVYAKSLLQQVRYYISGDYIEILSSGIATIDKEGNIVVFLEDSSNDLDIYEKTKEWKNIKSIYFVDYGLDALDSSGDFFTTVDNNLSRKRNEWLTGTENISLLSTAASNYVLVQEGGKVNAFSEYNSYLEEAAVINLLEKWNDVVDVVTGDNRIAVLHYDGTVSVVYANKLPGIPDPSTYNKYSNIYDDVELWTDIVDISAASTDCIVGLKSDGTVVVSNLYRSASTSYQEVKDWTNIIAISKSNCTILGLKKDGTVVAAGNLNEKQKEISTWKDVIAIKAGDAFHVGLKADGTILVAGEIDLSEIQKFDSIYIPEIKAPR